MTKFLVAKPHRWRQQGNISFLAAMLVSAVIAETVPFAAPAQAQESAETRLKRIEGELRAVQRKVFPDGAGRIFTPEITPPSASTGSSTGPSTTTVTDMLTRIDAIEDQLKRLTAQGEEDQNRLGKLETRLSKLETATPAAGAAPTALLPDATPAAEKTAPVAPRKAKPAPLDPARPAAAKPTLAKPSPDRVAAVKAIVLPQTGDAGEDQYLYGYELWNAKFFPESQQALQKFIDDHPKHKRMSYARNLLGRAFLDDSKPGTAAQWFVQNYQADKKGERAPDSLLYLAVAMTRLKETKRACVALTELKANFPDTVAGRLKGDYIRTRTASGCN